MPVKYRSGIKYATQKTVSDFASNTTIHGVQYVFDGTAVIIEKIAWLIICIGFTLLAIYWSLEIFDQWEEHPVLTSVGTTGNKNDFIIIQTQPKSTLYFCKVILLSRLWKALFSPKSCGYLYLYHNYIEIYIILIGKHRQRIFCLHWSINMI